MSNWHGIVGTASYLAGTSGTVTVPVGCAVVGLSVHASSNGASFTLLGGPSVTVVNGASPLQLNFMHTLWRATAASNSIVFTSTDHYRVDLVKIGNT